MIEGPIDNSSILLELGNKYCISFVAQPRLMHDFSTLYQNNSCKKRIDLNTRGSPNTVCAEKDKKSGWNNHNV